MSLEKTFDAVFATSLAAREKQIQQNYRPIIGVHKWFARRPGTLFRTLLLAEYNGAQPLNESYWKSHTFDGVIADPFMGGGTPIFEANRLGFSVIGADVNPMAHWIVMQSLTPLDLPDFIQTARKVVSDIDRQIGDLYTTRCVLCSSKAEVKYFLWVKTVACPHCREETPLFPRYLLAEAVRHPRNVLVCGHCGALNEYDKIPHRSAPAACKACSRSVMLEGNVSRQQAHCSKCGLSFRFQDASRIAGPPAHRLWALEYNCKKCKAKHVGRFFKTADPRDLKSFAEAQALLKKYADLPIPNDEIPLGDETARLHRWGYARYKEMFNERQLLGLGLLLRGILQVSNREVRHGLLTVFSDFLRYQNMLCRYDTYALKCQDIFSVHGFPVSLIQCENSLLGIPRVGSGAFRHFLEKYVRAKQYCLAPFETKFIPERRSKVIVPIKGESIKAVLTHGFPSVDKREAWLVAGPATTVSLPPGSLDGVFTDPPYYNNVQYAELMDFCFAWLRQGLKAEFLQFTAASTRTMHELTGNVTAGRGLDHFTEGLSSVFCHYSAALKKEAPFVFTFHHNDYAAYIPLVVAILDAGLNCAATLPAAAEMGASIHIAGTSSSILDSIFVCRKRTVDVEVKSIEQDLRSDIALMMRAGVRVTQGDVRCLATAHVARRAINRLYSSWDNRQPLTTRMSLAADCLGSVSTRLKIEALADKLSQPHTSGLEEASVAATV